MSKIERPNIFLHPRAGFSGALIDTVKFRVPAAYLPLPALVASNPNIVRLYDRYFVKNRLGTRAEIWSTPGEKTLTIQASLPEFLTGQDAFGILNLRQGCFELATEVLGILGGAVAGPIGWIDLLKFECVLHIATKTVEEWVALDTALEHFTVACRRDQSQSGLWEQARRVLNLPVHAQLGFERKGRISYTTSSDASMVEDLELAIEKSHRICLVIAGEALCRFQRVGSVVGGGQNLRPRRIQHAALLLVRSIAPVAQRIVLPDDLRELSETVRLRLRLWSLGDPYAFNLAQSARTRHRMTILQTVGVDIDSSEHWIDRRATLKTAKGVLAVRLSLKDRSNLWEALKAKACCTA